MKDLQYLKVKIELCRHCGGLGRVSPDKLHEDNEEEEVTCPICKGSGRVRVRREIRVVVESFETSP